MEVVAGTVGCPFQLEKEAVGHAPPATDVEGIGRDGNEGPPAVDKGKGCCNDGDERRMDGELDESVEALKGCTGFMDGRRIGSGPGEDGRSCVRYFD
jgi:hypothetical protein